MSEQRSDFVVDENGILRKKVTEERSVIPDNVTSISDRAFAHCYDLTTVSIPRSVTSIGEKAFYACESLEDIIIPSSVIYIGKNAFSACENLKTIFCEAAEKPSEWDASWTGDCTAEIVWGYDIAEAERIRRGGSKTKGQVEQEGDSVSVFLPPDEKEIRHKQEAEKAAKRKQEAEINAIIKSQQREKNAKNRAERAKKFGSIIGQLLPFVLPIAIFVVSLYFYPVWGMWSMVLIGITAGVTSVILSVKLINRANGWISFLSMFAGAVTGSVFIFICRELAYIALPLLIIDLICALYLLCSSEKTDESVVALSLFVGIALIGMSITSIVWCSGVWGTSPVSVDGTTIVHRLDRSEGTFTVKYYDERNELKKLNVPKADIIVVEDGYEKILNNSLSKCDKMYALYIPSSLTEIESGAIGGCKNLKAVYIGYNTDGTPLSESPLLEKIGYDAFANSPVEVIYFNGSIYEWENIRKEAKEGLFSDKEWDANMGEYKVVCNDGTYEYN